MKNNTEHYKEAIQLFKIVKDFTNEQLFNFMLNIAETNPSIFVSTIQKITNAKQEHVAEKHPIIKYFESEHNENALKLINILTKGYNVSENKLDIYHINTILDHLRANEKIHAIKVIRNMAELGLKDAKDVSDKMT